MNPSNPNKEYGEGNYKASREYNDATKEFVESGRVDEAARKAKPTSEDEAREMQRAEAEGRSHAKEEDPALHKAGAADRESDPRGTPRNERSADAKDTPKPGQEGE